MSCINTAERKDIRVPLHLSSIVRPSLCFFFLSSYFFSAVIVIRTWLQLSVLRGSMHPTLCGCLHIPAVWESAADFNHG